MVTAEATFTAGLITGKVITKTELREWIKRYPSKVRIVPQTDHPTPATVAVQTTADKLPRNVRVQVHGPVGFRSWSAELYWGRNGALVVK